MFCAGTARDWYGGSGTGTWHVRCAYWISGKMRSLEGCLSPCWKNLSWIRGRCSGVYICSCRNPLWGLPYPPFSGCEGSRGIWDWRTCGWQSVSGLFWEREHFHSEDSAVLQRRSGFHSGRILHHRSYTGAVPWPHCFCIERVLGHHSGGRCRCPEYHIQTGGWQGGSSCHSVFRSRGWDPYKSSPDGSQWSEGVHQFWTFGTLENGNHQKPIAWGGHICRWSWSASSFAGKDIELQRVSIV